MGNTGSNGGGGSGGSGGSGGGSNDSGNGGYGSERSPYQGSFENSSYGQPSSGGNSYAASGQLSRISNSYDLTYTGGCISGGTMKTSDTSPAFTGLERSCYNTSNNRTTNTASNTASNTVSNTARNTDPNKIILEQMALLQEKREKIGRQKTIEDHMATIRKHMASVQEKQAKIERQKTIDNNRTKEPESIKQDGNEITMTKEIGKEIIVSAKTMERPINISLIKDTKLDPGHHGVLVTTNKNNVYLLNGTTGGIKITDGKLSNEWKKVEDIKVAANKTIKDAYDFMCCAYPTPGMIQYLNSGTCIGAKNTCASFLSLSKEQLEEQGKLGAIKDIMQPQ